MDVDELERQTGVSKEIWAALLNPESEITTRFTVPAKGTPIGIGEAARKYELTQPTVTRWVQLEHVPVIEPAPGPGRKVLVDEHYVATLANRFHACPGTQGKRRHLTPALTLVS